MTCLCHCFGYRVVCRELGHYTGFPLHVYSNLDPSDPSLDTILLARATRCDGTETSLDDCSMELGPTVFCELGFSYAGVRCREYFNLKFYALPVMINSK